jgi:hypothetical protein
MTSPPFVNQWLAQQLLTVFANADNQMNQQQANHQVPQPPN